MKLAAAVALGRRSRAVLSPKRRTEIARLGGLARGRQIQARRAAKAAQPPEPPQALESEKTA